MKTLIALAFSLFFLGIVSASNPYIPIIITNNQNTATNAIFQQIISYNAIIPFVQTFEGNDLGNIRFYSGSQALYSWCENCTLHSSTTQSNTLFFVKLTNSIPGRTSIAINATFLPSNTEFDGNVAGECPTCSITAYNVVTTTNVIAFSTASLTSALATVATPTVGPVGGNLWLCGAGEGSSSFGASYSTSYSIDQEDSSGPWSSIGHQAGNTCQTTDQGPWGQVAIGINTNGISYSFQGMESDNADPSFTFATTGKSFTVMIMACGGDKCAPTLAGGLGTYCVDKTGTVSSDNKESAQLWTCNVLPAGASWSLSGTTPSANDNSSIAIYSFYNTTTTNTPVGYAKFDNGNNIFNLYDNFAGNTLNANIWHTLGSCTISVNNGITMSNPGAECRLASNANFITGVFDSDMIQSSNWPTSCDGLFNVFRGANSGNNGYFEGWDQSCGLTNVKFWRYTGIASGFTNIGTVTFTVPSNWNTVAHVGSIMFTQNTMRAQLDFGNPSVSASSDATYGLGAVGYRVPNVGSGPGFVQWIDVRSFPPNAVMPSSNMGGSVLNNLACTTQISNFFPTNGVIYLDFDSSNQMTFANVGEGSNPNTIIIPNGNQQFNFGPSSLAAFQLNNTGNAIWTYNILAIPMVYLQCFPLVVVVNQWSLYSIAFVLCGIASAICLKKFDWFPEQKGYINKIFKMQLGNLLLLVFLMLAAACIVAGYG